MKSCAYCGKENSDDAESCGGCGTNEFAGATVALAPVETRKSDIELTAATPSDTQEHLAYLTVTISAEGISEVHGGRTVVFVSKPDMQGIRLATGSGAERPVLQLGFGILLAAVGACGLIPLWSGNMTLFRYEIGFVFFGLMGVWLLWETLRKHTFLLVSTRSEARKLFFKGAVDPKKLEEFLSTAETRFGYVISSNLRIS